MIVEQREVRPRNRRVGIEVWLGVFAPILGEGTAERIRDKIAASKGKGMWMGGTPPLGYAPDGRSLRVVEEHAAMVRDIFARYLDLGNVRLVADCLAREGKLSPARATATGRAYGGVPLSRGQLYKLLSCPTYVGEVHHGGKVYPGLHQPIVARETWDQVQALLAGNLQGGRGRVASPSPLAGKVVDAAGRPFATSHACKAAEGASEARRRYRYYLSHDAAAGQGMRVPARELEAAVAAQVAGLFADAIALVAAAWLEVAPSRLAEVTARCAEVAAELTGRGHGPMPELVERVRVHDARIEIDCATSAIADLLGVERAADAPATLALVRDARLTRSGRAMRLVHDNGAAAARRPNPAAVRLLVKARSWWARLRAGDIDITRLAEREGVMPGYVTRVLRLAFLSPAVTDAILAGNTAAHVDGAALVATGAIPPDWGEQARMLLPEA